MVCGHNKGTRPFAAKFLQSVQALAVVLAVSATAVAQSTVYWDIDGATPGAGGPTPSGTWSGTAANWSSSAAGDVATAAWVSGTGAGDGNVAFFSAGSDATGSFTVTIDGKTVDFAEDFKVGFGQVVAIEGKLDEVAHYGMISGLRELSVRTGPVSYTAFLNREVSAMMLFRGDTCVDTRFLFAPTP